MDIPLYGSCMEANKTSCTRQTALSRRRVCSGTPRSADSPKSSAIRGGHCPGGAWMAGVVPVLDRSIL